MTFADAYPEDVSNEGLERELTSLLPFILHLESPPSTAEQLLQYLCGWDDDVCPNLRNCLRILLTIASSIAGCERSMSKLKIILNHLRNSMRQERLSNLSMLSIEKEITNSLNFDELIETFVRAKARKAVF